MLKDLFDAIASGKLQIDVIDLRGSSEPQTENDKRVAEYTRLMDTLSSTESVVRALHALYKRRGYTGKADEIKTWFTNTTDVINELNTQIVETPVADKEKLAQLVDEVLEHLRPMVPALKDKVHAITERQILAVCEVEIDDLLY